MSVRVREADSPVGNPHGWQAGEGIDRVYCRQQLLDRGQQAEYGAGGGERAFGLADGIFSLSVCL